MTLAPSPTRQILLTETGHLTPEPRIHYINYTFTVPEQASRVGLTFRFHKERVAQLFVSLYDPQRFRGNRMKPGAKGDVVLELWCSPDDSSEGAVVGALPAGEWRVQIDIEALAEETDYQLETYADFDPVPPALELVYPDDHIVKGEAGWYKGELHAHSTESDGKHPVATVVQAALDAQLDYFALTDHFTISQWRKLLPHLEKPLALLRSTEITSHQGHANLHGMKDWVDVYVDRADWSMNDAADAIHAQGGLFCVNHAYSGRLGWRAWEFDWAKADLIEIYHNLEGINSVYQLTLWDRLLLQGYCIVGVAGIDSHDHTKELHQLGQLVTWVYANELSEMGIVAGLQRGQVYVSKGPQLRFSGQRGEHHAAMWEALPLSDDAPVTLTVEVLTDEPLRVFALKDGLPLEHTEIEASADWQTVTFSDVPHKHCYYRVELHSTTPDALHHWIPTRDHRSMRALTNPVWVS